MTPRHGRGPNHVNRRYWGMLALAAVIFGFVGTLITISAGIHPLSNETFHHIDRKPYQHAHNPIVLAQMGLPANSTQANTLPTTPAVRAIVAEPGTIKLLAAGKVIKQIPYTGASLDLPRIMQLVNDPAMIQEGSSGQIVLKVALIARHIKLTVGSPLVSEVRMVDTGSVFIGAEGGSLTFDTVTVRTIPSDDPSAEWYQPFVMATDKATMDTRGSTFTGLGWDSNASYGVSWVEGSTGSVTDSIFEKSFIGVYTSEAVGMAFRNSTFRNNALYGLDPHTHSTNLTIDNVLAEGNRAHGIIFSEYVTASSITNSTSRNNGENGIMMDEFSTGNVIKHNTITGNTGDGLVTARSADNKFVGNTVTGNRVGIRLDPKDTATTAVLTNRVANNGVASEHALLNSSNESLNNGGQWNWTVVRTTWIVVAGLLVLTALALTRTRRQPQLPPRLSTV